MLPHGKAGFFRNVLKDYRSLIDKTAGGDRAMFLIEDRSVRSRGRYSHAGGPRLRLLLCDEVEAEEWNEDPQKQSQSCPQKQVRRKHFRYYTRLDGDRFGQTITYF